MLARFAVAHEFGLPLDAVLNMGVMRFAAHVAFLQIKSDAARGAT